jgi:hypothetical protein
MDLMVAAIASSRGLPIYTCNADDFDELRETVLAGDEAVALLRVETLQIKPSRLTRTGPAGLVSGLPDGRCR